MRARQNTHKWSDLSFGDAVVGAIVYLLLILLLPIILPFLLYLYIRTKIENREFEKYIRSNEGAKFFVYTSRRTSEKYVRENILPFLPSDTRIIYLGDSKKLINLGDDQPFLDQFIYRVRGTPGSYPYVAKITRGKLVSLSINQQLYSAITRNADAEAIKQKIDRFLTGTK